MTVSNHWLEIFNNRGHQIEFSNFQGVADNIVGHKLIPIDPPESVNSAAASTASTIDELLDWRVRDRLRTVAAGLLLCLHLGVDPPDVWKPSPCARWECWIDPQTGNPIRKVGIDESTDNTTDEEGTNSTEKVREAIARNLLLQYETWQPRVRYKTLLDPTVEDLRKLCTSLRKSAKHERVLLHYNGHGVPRPTRNGELWVFNKQFTQYIPVNVADIITWIGTPSVWILDCPAAAFLSHSLQKVITSVHINYDSFTSVSGNTAITSNTTDSDNSSQSSANPLSLILFAACDSHETLPFTPSLPADILTSCLTTPLDMAIRWHCHIGGPLLPQSLSPETALQIPGKLSDRRTPLGELNWIFTAITDTIAWLVLPRELFRRLYRQDLLIASLSRNYLLAQRILKSLYCTSSAYPSLPPTHQHHLWTLWDHALDTLLAQLSQLTSPVGMLKQSTFFPDQLDAFDLWVRQHRSLPPNQISGPPDQLPAALQVLLSQNLRPRALRLFAEFCDFGPWACLECLHVGIHPYILKLISSNIATSPTVNNESVTKSLLHIWTRLMSVDPTCKTDLLKDSAFLYFVNTFEIDPLLATKALVAFGSDNPAGRDRLLSNELFRELLQKNQEILQDNRQKSDSEVIWRLFLNSVYNNYNDKSTKSIYNLIVDSDNPQIRAAALFSLSLNDPQARETLKDCLRDPSPFVRLEILNLASQDPKTFDQIIGVLCDDPYEPIAEKASKLLSDDCAPILDSYLISHYISCNDSVEMMSSFNDLESKYRALNQLEIDSWLERPISTRKFDSQISVIETHLPIRQILFHPVLSHVFLLDASGVLKQWNWESDPDVPYAYLQEFTLACSPSDVIITRSGQHIVSCGTEGAVRITDTQNNLITAFNCQDRHVKVMECKNGFYIAGDAKVSLYNSTKQKLTSINRPSVQPSGVTCLIEIEENQNQILIGTRDGSIEFINFQDDSESRTVLPALQSEILHFWCNNNRIYALSDNCTVFCITVDRGNYSADDWISCECINTFHFGSVAGLTSAVSHPVLKSLFVYGGIDQSVRLAEFTEKDLCQFQSIRYHDGFLGQRLGNIGQVTWHPSRMVFAVTSSDTFVSIYGK